jgi:hypothetical protein
MMRVVTTFLLLLSFLLVRGHHHLYAHAYHQNTSYSPVKLLEQSEHLYATCDEDSTTTIGQALPADEQNGALDATEMEDEEDSFSSRKYVEITNYFLSFFYAQASGALQPSSRQRLPFCEHLSYQSSFKYIIQRVIRI